MTLTVIVGGQYGSEGKGKLAAHLATTAKIPVASVRTGGSNSGHTAYRNGQAFKLRQLPCGAVSNGSRLYMAAGMAVDVPVLMGEMHDLAIDPRRLMIDRNAIVMDPSDAQREESDSLRERIGSTLSGTGAATARKVMRDPSLRRVADAYELAHVTGNVSDALNAAIDRGEHVVIEGTQGFGLSLHHSNHYPYVTSRDTTAAAFLSEVGLSPLLVTDIILVIRTFPIRVAGNSGPLENEITWKEVRRQSGSPHPLAEYTTVTGNLRRVGEADWDMMGQAIQVNRPTAIALHGLDYLDHDNYGVSRWRDLTSNVVAAIEALQRRFGVPVRYAFTGPDVHHIVEVPT